MHVHTMVAVQFFGRAVAPGTVADLPLAAHARELAERFPTRYGGPRDDNVLDMQVWLMRVRR